MLSAGLLPGDGARTLVVPPLFPDAIRSLGGGEGGGSGRRGGEASDGDDGKMVWRGKLIGVHTPLVGLSPSSSSSPV